MKTEESKTMAAIRCENAFSKYKTKGTGQVIFPWFHNGFNDGEASMIELHSGIVNLVREYLFIFQDENGLVNNAFKTELEKIDRVLGKNET